MKYKSKHKTYKKEKVKKGKYSKGSKKFSSKKHHHEYLQTKGDQKQLVDFHIHSVGSSDGRYEIPALVKRARAFDVNMISITDHNNFNETLRYLNGRGEDLTRAIHDIDGIDFVPGVEITCRVPDVKNLKGNDLKVHLLAYSPLLTDDSYLVRLMKIKHGNDLAVDFGFLLNIAKLKGIQLDHYAIREFLIHKRMREDSGFSSFGREDVIDFFRKEKIPVAKSMREYELMFERIPRAERLNLNAQEVIDLVHASGGMCVMAHPKVHLNRTNNKRDAVDSLLEYGIDGFELMTPSMDNETFELITRECGRFRSKNPLLYTGGSDFHIYSEQSKIGRFGTLPITSKSQAPFIRELSILDRARDEDCITHRNYRLPIKADLDAIIDRYSARAHQINEIYSEAQKGLDVEEIEDKFSNSTMSYVDYLRAHGVYDEEME